MEISFAIKTSFYQNGFIHLYCCQKIEKDWTNHKGLYFFRAIATIATAATTTTRKNSKPMNAMNKEIARTKISLSIACLISSCAAVGFIVCQHQDSFEPISLSDWNDIWRWVSGPVRARMKAIQPSTNLLYDGILLICVLHGEYEFWLICDWGIT